MCCFVCLGNTREPMQLEGKRERNDISVRDASLAISELFVQFWDGNKVIQRTPGGHLKQGWSFALRRCSERDAVLTEQTLLGLVKRGIEGITPDFTFLLNGSQFFELLMLKERVALCLEYIDLYLVVFLTFIFQLECDLIFFSSQHISIYRPRKQKLEMKAGKDRLWKPFLNTGNMWSPNHVHIH